MSGPYAIGILACPEAECFREKACQILPNRAILNNMGTMNISLPDSLKDFVDEQVKRGYGTSSEYVRELIRRDQERLHLRELLLAGAASKPAAPADSRYFKRLRNRVHAARRRGAQR